jgi:hypothetical protein
MASGAAFETGGIDGPAACHKWLGRLPQESGERLEAVTALVARISDGNFAVDVAFEMLELARASLLVDAERHASRLRNAPLPFTQASITDWREVATALDRLHRAYRSLHARIDETDGLDTRAVIPGARNELRQVMPLARALDAMSRRLAFAQLARIEIDPIDWFEFSDLARHMRRTTFLDEPLPDPMAIARPVNARAAITYPLLLKAVGLEGRPAAHAGLVDRLARRWATRVGYRFDSGLELAENPYGPTLWLGPRLSVRLDTHRIRAKLAERREGWLASARAAGRAAPGMDRASLSHLLDELGFAWSARNRGGIYPIGQPAPIRLRVGMPTFHRSRAEMAAAAGRGHNPYAYGRWEQNTILRLALGKGREGDEALLALAGECEKARRVAQDAGTWLVDRQAMTPPARHGELVAIVIDASDAQAGAEHLLLARVVAVRQVIPAPGAKDQRTGHRLRLAVMTGRAQPVGIRGQRHADHVDAFLLESAGESALVAATDAVVSGETVWLRRGDEDLRARVGELLDRGRGHERFSLRFDAA